MIEHNTSCPPNIPGHLWHGIKHYVLERQPVGDFLTAVITNNLVRAIQRADARSLEALTDVVRYFYNETPIDCWGSVEKMEAWLGLEE